jgi:hypothetical protein
MSFVGDIVEREPAAARPPSAPTFKKTSSGFPEPKNRTRTSAFKQQRASARRMDPAGGPPPAFAKPLPPTQTNPSTLTNSSFEDVERRNIDKENRKRMAAMSAEEIEEERRELLSSLSPDLIQSLLKRANLDDGRGDTDVGLEKLEKPEKLEIAPSESTDASPRPTPVSSVDPAAVSVPQPAGKRHTAAKTVTFEDDAEPAETPSLQPASTFTREALADATPAVHFPSAPSAPELDPSDPSFLENLHTKYFPSLPADPSKLAWMAPIPTHGSVADQESPYYPNQEAITASALRFDFRGGLLPPRISRAMPTNKGLHHHGEAPESAGYTVPELARLARSAYPAQRCVAFQTLGRFLYRLGRGEWGDEGSEMAKGLWRCVEEGKVINTLEGAAGLEGGHQGSKTYAIEAVWLWQKGGGRVWKAA